MNRAQRMYEVLRDGRPHSRREIFDRAGFMLTNNAASELRAAGHEVSQWRERDHNGGSVYFYRLGSWPESSQSVALDPPSNGSDARGDGNNRIPIDGGRDDSGEQLRLEAA